MPTGPILGLDVEVWLGLDGVYECNEEDVDFRRSATDGVPSEVLEGDLSASQLGPAPSCRPVT